MNHTSEENKDKLNDNLYRFYEPPDRHYNVIIIFFHGFQQGDYKYAWETTWTSSNNICWPRDILPKHYPRARILSASYDSSAIRSATTGRFDDLLPIAGNILNGLKCARIGRSDIYPMLMIGHDLGCVVIKKVITMMSTKESMLIQSEWLDRVLKSVKGFVFYSPFTQGVSHEWLTADPGKANRLTELQVPLNKEMAQLNNFFEQIRNSLGMKVLVLVESFATAVDENSQEHTDSSNVQWKTIVSPASAISGADHSSSVSGDHHTMCKHERDTDTGYQLVQTWLNEYIIDSTEMLETILTKDLFEKCFPKSLYKYEDLIEGARDYGFGITGNIDQRKRDIAAFLCHVHDGTSGMTEVEDDAPEHNYCETDEPYSEFRCVEGKSYHWRGPLQLCWNYHYGRFGKKIGEDLLLHPEKVSKDPIIGFKSAVWYWCTEQWNIPSCHDVMTGKWVPKRKDREANRFPGFGLTTRIIQGTFYDDEGRDVEAASARLDMYENFCMELHVHPGEHLTSYDQNP